MVFLWNLKNKFSSGVQDFLEYYDGSQQCFSFNSLDSSYGYQFFLSHFYDYGNRSKYWNYNWYHCHTHLPWHFSSLARSKNLSNSRFVLFSQLYPPEWQNVLDGKSFYFFLIATRTGYLTGKYRSDYILKSQKFMRRIFLDRFRT